MSRRCEWTYVSSSDNPADLISRGLDPVDIINNDFWFHGPNWLASEKGMWPNCKPKDTNSDVPELKSTVVALTTSVLEPNNNFICKYSSYRKLLRITALILRFKDNSLRPAAERNLGDLTIHEIDKALICLVKLVQMSAFQAEITTLSASRSLSRRSALLSLNPYLDDNKVLRVGGRLSNSSLKFDAKHPIILPSKHHFTYLLVRHEHLTNLHAGPQLILSNLRQRFWPIRGRLTVRSVLNKCITCLRVAPKPIIQKMADLPSSRVTPVSRPFVVCGVDYAGPFQIKDSKFRNRKFIKAYLCIFVCFSTKAVHIEVVSELSADGFLNSFKRFIGRRGLCSHMYSDCGTNFVAAEKELMTFANHCRDSGFKEFLLENKITWHFSPARSPHFGGLWEAAVRRAKHHLKRIIQGLTLSYQDFYTICVQIESILNSRPLCPLTEDPEDYESITPGHFLIGDSLKSLPELPVMNERMSHISRYKQMKFTLQRFWSLWSKDYLQTLQQRSKWKFSNGAVIKVGDLVLLHEENIVPTLWKMGRISEVHPGRDGVVRVVTVKTRTGLYKRSVTKVSLLPTDGTSIMFH